MKTRLVQTKGFRGPETEELPADGEMVTFREDVDHGDWKTVAARGGWPTIPEGTPVKVVGWMQNCYGVHIRVEYKGYTYDVEKYKLCR